MVQSLPLAVDLRHPVQAGVPPAMGCKLHTKDDPIALKLGPRSGASDGQLDAAVQAGHALIALVLVSVLHTVVVLQFRLILAQLRPSALQLALLPALAAGFARVGEVAVHF